MICSRQNEAAEFLNSESNETERSEVKGDCEVVCAIGLRQGNERENECLCRLRATGMAIDSSVYELLSAVLLVHVVVFNGSNHGYICCVNLFIFDVSTRKMIWFNVYVYMFMYLYAVARFFKFLCSFQAYVVVCTKKKAETTVAVVGSDSLGTNRCVTCKICICRYIVVKT